MFVVLINGEKHSVWNTWKEADYQINVLVEYGYPSCEMEIDEISEEYENGHYFY